MVSSSKMRSWLGNFKRGSAQSEGWLTEKDNCTPRVVSLLRLNREGEMAVGDR